MDKVKRNAAIVKERTEKNTPYEVLGEKYNITGARAHQIYMSAVDKARTTVKETLASRGRRHATAFYDKLPKQRATTRIKRMVVTKDDIARKFNVPSEKLEIRV